MMATIAYRDMGPTHFTNRGDRRVRGLAGPGRSRPWRQRPGPSPSLLGRRPRSLQLVELLPQRGIDPGVHLALVPEIGDAEPEVVPHHELDEVLHRGPRVPLDVAEDLLD